MRKNSRVHFTETLCICGLLGASMLLGVAPTLSLIHI